MKIVVTLQETTTKKVKYYVDGANSLEAAKKCAIRAHNKQYQPNAKQIAEEKTEKNIEASLYEVLD